MAKFVPNLRPAPRGRSFGTIHLYGGKRVAGRSRHTPKHPRGGGRRRTR